MLPFFGFLLKTQKKHSAVKKCNQNEKKSNSLILMKETIKVLIVEPANEEDIRLINTFLKI